MEAIADERRPVVRLSEPTKKLLDSLSVFTGIPRGKLVDRALRVYAREVLPRNESNDAT